MMGGRGGVGGGLGRATSEQRRIIGNMRAAISKDTHKTAPEFRVRSDGVVEYTYTETRNYARVHGGKMQSEWGDAATAMAALPKMQDMTTEGQEEVE